MIAKDIMIDKLEALDINDTLGTALQSIQEHNIRYLPVLDQGKLVGILGDRDLKPVLLPVDQYPEVDEFVTKQLEKSVGEVMRTDLITVAPDVEMMDLIDETLFQCIGALLVVDPFDGKLVGIVSYADVLWAFQREHKQVSASVVGL